MFRFAFATSCIAVPSLILLASSLFLCGGCFVPPADAIDATEPPADSGTVEVPSDFIYVVTFVRRLNGEAVEGAGVALHDLQSPTPYMPVTGTWSLDGGAALVAGSPDMPCWYVSTSALDYVETHTFYPNADFSELDGRTAWLLSDRELDEIAYALDRRVEDGSWTVVRVVDERGLPVVGATVSAERGEVFYLGDEARFGDTKGTGDDGLAVIFDAPEGLSMIRATEGEGFQLNTVEGDARFGAGMVVHDPSAVTFVELAIH